MSRAYINGVEVIIYDFQNGEAKCYVPSLDIKGWYGLDQIEVKHVK